MPNGEHSPRNWLITTLVSIVIGVIGSIAGVFHSRLTHVEDRTSETREHVAGMKQELHDIRDGVRRIEQRLSK